MSLKNMNNYTIIVVYFIDWSGNDNSNTKIHNAKENK